MRSRLESRPATVGNAITTWGPWTTDVRLNSLIAEVSTDGTVGYRRPRLSVSLVGAGVIACYYGNCIPQDSVSRMSAFAGAQMLDSQQAFNIDPVTGNVTYISLTTATPLVIPIPTTFLIPVRATLALDFIDGLVTDDVAGLVATIEDEPQWRD